MRSDSRRENDVYCAEHWDELMETMTRVVTYIGEGAATVYVGRTNYPERRLLEHLRDREHDRLAVLHWTANRFEIEEIERLLIAHVKRRFPLKTKNRDDESSGARSGPWNATDVSWREMNKAKPVPVRWHEVTNLDQAPLAPAPGFMPFPTFLQSRVTRDRVNGILEERYRPLR